MNTRVVVAVLALALGACGSEVAPHLATGASGGGGEGGTGSAASSVSSASSSGGGGSEADGGDAGGDAGDGGCTYGATYCEGNFCECALSPPSPNCVTADSNGTPAGDCDDGNPCTQDVADPSAPDGCRHLFFGLGASCSADHAMQCVVGGTGEQCCPTDPHPTCSAEGVQAECASGSVCLEGRCWIACVTPKDCAGSPVGSNCDTLAVGHVAVKVCGN